MTLKKRKKKFYNYHHPSYLKISKSFIDYASEISQKLEIFSLNFHWILCYQFDRKMKKFWHI